ncbi:hypothetical protein Acsp04_66010 [Actinomadura sp. NBRC 104425]|nr:hypothetical protein Acsp04_66010 [Actinomadura sp. NBRC 104425]
MLDWLWGRAPIDALPVLIAIVRGADKLMLVNLVNALCCATVLGPAPHHGHQASTPAAGTYLPPASRHRGAQ